MKTFENGYLDNIIFLTIKSKRHTPHTPRYGRTHAVGRLLAVSNQQLPHDYGGSEQALKGVLWTRLGSKGQVHGGLWVPSISGRDIQPKRVSRQIYPFLDKVPISLCKVSIIVAF